MAKALGVVTEERCVQSRGGSTRTPEGFSLLRNADGVLMGYGVYRNSVRTGLWRAWSLMGSVHAQWLKHRQGDADTLAIDFCACRPEEAEEPWGFGTNGLQVSAAGPDSCRLQYFLEREQGYYPERIYVVPRTLGLWGLHVRDGRFYMPPLEPYFRGTTESKRNLHTEE